MLQGADNAHLFSVAQRQILHPAAHIQLEPLAESLGFLFTVLFVESGGEPQHLGYLHPRIKGDFRGQIAHPGQNLRFLLPDVQPQHRGGAAGGMDEAQQGADGGAFSRAVGADEAEEVPLLHGQVQILNAPGGAIEFG